MTSVVKQFFARWSENSILVPSTIASTWVSSWEKP